MKLGKYIYKVTIHYKNGAGRKVSFHPVYTTLAQAKREVKTWRKSPGFSRGTIKKVATGAK